ncbi:MAG TPA: N-acetyltransferase [Polyangiaceae bacterium]
MTAGGDAGLASSGYRCERASSAHAEALLELFESAGSGCFCNYWHFEGDKNAWLEQCYLHPQRNRDALLAQLAAPELCGIVAIASASANQQRTTRIAGWLKVTPAASVPRLYDQRVYRQLPAFAGERAGVFAVGCCFVAEEERGQGVLRELVAAAPSIVAAAGGVAIEAFPRGAVADAEPLRPDEVWRGPETLFVEQGFVAVSDFRPYPVLRLRLV